jgi:hypothetical protein
MAKTMQHTRTDEVKRVSNSEAKELHKTGKWKYIGKYQGKRIVESNNEENN